VEVSSKHLAAIALQTGRIKEFSFIIKHSFLDTSSSHVSFVSYA
jgi:hypothetical protein